MSPESRVSDLSRVSYEEHLGDPGQYPFTRGLISSGYRVKPWTMRQFAGHKTAKETNQRFKYLLAHGETGLSTAFDLPTLMGIDADDPRALGEVGREGVSITSLADFETLFSGIDLAKISTSMTINLPAPVMLAMYLIVAEKQGVPWKRVRGTLQTDILKEYIAQNEYLFPPEPSLRLVLDTIEFCVKEVPRFYPISISGYHIREAGATAVQELAFTLSNGREYVQRLVARGLPVDEFANHLSFFFDVHNYFFEEIAKLRAGRRIWARMMKEEFKAQKMTSLFLPIHCQTAGVSLTAQQPLNNLIRTTYQALAAVLGGTQSLHTNSFDEALALPSDEAVRLALRTQQIIAFESGVSDTADPLGGSFHLESLTNRVEEKALELMARIQEVGGVLPALERGFFHREISESAYRYETDLLSQRRKIIGVNVYTEKTKRPKILKIRSQIEHKQIRSVQQLKKNRNNAEVDKSLRILKETAKVATNTLPCVIEAVRSYATLGEIVSTLKEVFGEYRGVTVL
ncbi:MAG: methylmalonyl-CoA mutase [Elusimicrobia bacterium]|nr:methylmalonyl-CoA mutase [Elusimicrobiota bacterium]